MIKTDKIISYSDLFIYGAYKPFDILCASNKKEKVYLSNILSKFRYLINDAFHYTINFNLTYISDNYKELKNIKIDYLDYKYNVYNFLHKPFYVLRNNKINIVLTKYTFDKSFYKTLI